VVGEKAGIRREGEERGDDIEEKVGLGWRPLI
jgi:hypothetical protein